MPIGRLIRKIQCQLKESIIQPPRIGPKIGPSSIGMPSTAITRPIRRAGGAGQDRHAERHQHAAAEALQHPEAT